MLTSCLAILAGVVSLLTAIVRWRREVDVRALKQATGELRWLRKKIDELEGRLNASQREREDLQQANRKLQALCDEQAREIERLNGVNGKQEAEMKELRARLFELEQKLKELAEKGNR